MDYKGMKCSVCGKPFSANDDIVVCPECGAPYHRECYAKTGKCVYADRHGTPDAWRPPQPQPAEEKVGNVKRCPRCGAPNQKAALFCAHCGQPLADENERPQGNPFPNQSNNPYSRNANMGGWNGMPPQGGYPPPNGNVPPDYGFPFVFDPLGGVNPNEPVDGVPAGDVAKFVQGNTQYYIPTFLGLSRFKRNRFNFSAFFFTGIWMLYRKLYKIGTIITVLEGALVLSYFFLLKYFILPLYDKLYTAVGITQNYNGYYTMTASQQNALMQKIYSLPALQKFTAISPMLFLLGFFALMLVCGFIANRIYLKSCVEHITKIKDETTSPTDAAVRLQQEGGMNTALASSLFFCFFLILFFCLF